MHKADSANAALFSELNENIHALGLTRSDTVGTVTRMIAWYPILAGLWWVAWVVSSSWAALALAATISVLQTQFAFIGHDASHGSAAHSTWGNRLAGRLTMGLVGGLCFREWQYRHLMHHKHCQDQARDPDMQFGTVFSLSEEARASKTGVGNLMAPYQGWYFWPSTLLFAYSLRALSFLAAAQSPRKYLGDLVSVVGHVALFLALPLVLGVDPSRVLLVYLASTCFLGLRLATVFTVNHVGMPARIPGTSHLEHQLATSRNVGNAPSMDWYFGGLNFQIEHHLFPGCPRGRLREARALVRPRLLREGMGYHETSWLTAANEVTRHVHAIGNGRSGASVRPATADDERAATETSLHEGF